MPQLLDGDFEGHPCALASITNALQAVNVRLKPTS